LELALVASEGGFAMPPVRHFGNPFDEASWPSRFLQEKKNNILARIDGEVMVM
jgi:hypothetical protein